MEGPLACSQLDDRTANYAILTSSTLSFYANADASARSALLAAIELGPDSHVTAGRDGNTSNSSGSWEIILSTPSIPSSSTLSTSLSASTASSFKSLNLRRRSSVKKEESTNTGQCSSGSSTTKAQWLKAKLRSKSVSQTALTAHNAGKAPPLPGAEASINTDNDGRRLSFSHASRGLPWRRAEAARGQAHEIDQAETSSSTIVLTTTSQQLREAWLRVIQTAIHDLSSSAVTVPSNDYVFPPTRSSSPVVRASLDNSVLPETYLRSSLPLKQKLELPRFSIHAPSISFLEIGDDEHRLSGTYTPSVAGGGYQSSRPLTEDHQEAEAEEDETEELDYSHLPERTKEGQRSLSMLAVHATPLDDGIDDHKPRRSREERRSSAPVCNPLLPQWLDQIRASAQGDDPRRGGIRTSRSSSELCTSASAAAFASPNQSLAVNQSMPARGIKISLHASDRSEGSSIPEEARCITNASYVSEFSIMASPSPPLSVEHHRFQEQTGIRDSRRPGLKNSLSFSSLSTASSPLSLVRSSTVSGSGSGSRLNFDDLEPDDEEEPRTPMPGSSYAMNPNRPISPIIYCHDASDDLHNLALSPTAASVAGGTLSAASAKKLANFFGSSITSPTQAPASPPVPAATSARAAEPLQSKNGRLHSRAMSVFSGTKAVTIATGGKMKRAVGHTLSLASAPLPTMTSSAPPTSSVSMAHTLSGSSASSEGESSRSSISRESGSSSTSASTDSSSSECPLTPPAPASAVSVSPKNLTPPATAQSDVGKHIMEPAELRRRMEERLAQRQDRRRPLLLSGQQQQLHRQGIVASSSLGSLSALANAGRKGRPDIGGSFGDLLPLRIPTTKTMTGRPGTAPSPSEPLKNTQGLGRTLEPIKHSQSSRTLYAQKSTGMTSPISTSSVGNSTGRSGNTLSPISLSIPNASRRSSPLASPVNNTIPTTTSKDVQALLAALPPPRRRAATPKPQYCASTAR